MSEDIKNEELEAMSEEEGQEIIVFPHEDGTEEYFVADCHFDVDGKTYAVLVNVTSLVGEDGCGCGCEDHHHDEDCECGFDGDEYESFIARVDYDEDGEPVYAAPETEEEFEKAKAAYNALDFEDEE